MTVDFGFFKSACIGDKVWLDKNANGIEDSDEKGISGVTVKLLDSNGNPISGKEAVTDSDGKYQFCNLNQYQVKRQ